MLLCPLTHHTFCRLEAGAQVGIGAAAKKPSGSTVEGVPREASLHSLLEQTLHRRRTIGSAKDCR